MIEHSEVWAPVEKESERERVLRGSVEQGKDLLLEGAHSGLPAKAAGWRGNDWEIAKIDGAWPFKDGDFISVRFVFDGEDYFFKAVAAIDGDRLILTLPAQIFQLQKRKHFRIVLPEEFPSRFVVLKRDEGEVPVSGRVLDINDFGLRFLSKGTHEFKTGEKVEGTFRLGERRPVTVAGVVRQCGPLGEGTQIGLEFDFHVLATADQVQAAILFYRHDIFHFRKSKN